MRKLWLPLLLLILSGGWCYLLTWHYQGLNSLQNLADYRTGLLSKQPLPNDKTQQWAFGFAGAQVSIDSLGIPHIFGKDVNSTAYSLGYLHAKDRYFQMELIAHTMMGRLAEIIGPEGLRSDRRWRMYQMEQRAGEWMDSVQLSIPVLHDYLNAYAEGVNAYVSNERLSYQDPMYVLWGYTPRPWKPSYAFLIQWYMSSTLTFHDDYVDRQEILEKLPPSVRQILYPEHRKNEPYIIPVDGQSAGTAAGQSLVNLFPHAKENHYQSLPLNRSLGSNNWVVGASRTAQKQVFLCNDLHLKLVSPNIFYEVQLSSPEFNSYGYTIPGVPVIVTGHNNQIAWGITSGEWDVTEQYLLKINPEHKDQYWLDGKWETMSSKELLLQVKGSAPKKVTVSYTVFGPSIQKDSLSYAIQWHPGQSATAIPSFWKMMKAGNWNEFRESLRHYDFPAQNFVYGDVKGNIGMVCAGKMPIKPLNYGGGLLDGTISPIGKYIPFDSLPQSYNPARDYLFSANQEPQVSPYYFSSRWFSDTYRPRRIDELLDSAKQLNRQQMQQLQLDITDLSVRDVQDLVEKYLTGNLSGNWSSLKQWSGQLDPDSKESFFYKCFRQAAFLLGQDIAKKMKVKGAPSFDQLMHFLKSNDTLSWNGQAWTPGMVFTQLTHMADSVFDKNKHLFPGAKVYAFTVPQITSIPGLDVTVDKVGGSDNTINVNYGAHPVIRTLIELKEGRVNSWMVNALGQTGRINDEHYFQQLASWKQNALHLTQFVSSPEALQSVQQTITFSSTK